VPPFADVRVDELAAALEEGMAAQLAEIEAIAAQPEPATFENTIVAMERAGQPLARAWTLFSVWGSTMSSVELRKIEEDLAPKLSMFRDRIIQNSRLFARVQAVYDLADAGWTAEQRRLVLVVYQQFTRQGASLSDEKKAILSGYNQALASLYTRFAQNQLGDEEHDALIIERADELAGLPREQIDAARAEADRRGLDSKWVISNTRSSMEPFLTSSSHRGLRQRAFEIWTRRGDNGNERDNNAIVGEILTLRAQKAALLGFKTFAHWQLADSMAKDPEIALGLMWSVWKPALAQFQLDVAETQALIDAEGGGFALAPWDYRYYAEKLRKAKYDLDFEQLKPYMQLDRLRQAMFWAAGSLYGLRFVEVFDLPRYHPDTSVFEVLASDGGHIGYWYFDPFARPGKQSGAWMSAYREQHRLDGDVTTIVSNNANFIKAQPGESVTISWDDARTLFHEFGHALHGLLSKVTYPTLSGTNTTRDFVELPSQFYENYLQTPEVLAFLVDDRGEKIPADLLARMQRAQRFNQGFATAETQASAIVDMRLHLASGPIDPRAFEKTIAAELGMPAEMVMRHRIPAFGHVFSGDGYAAGYYSYIWAEVLDFDAYEAFVEAGSPYDPATAQRFCERILSVGNTVDPGEAFRQFRGRDPDAGALLRAKGFA